eukprot:scaffold330_cov396-Prasinococcus_capsulatus_cf.AAC.3
MSTCKHIQAAPAGQGSHARGERYPQPWERRVGVLQPRAPSDLLRRGSPPWRQDVTGDPSPRSGRTHGPLGVRDQRGTVVHMQVLPEQSGGPPVALPAGASGHQPHTVHVLLVHVTCSTCDMIVSCRACGLEQGLRAGSRVRGCARRAAATVAARRRALARWTRRASRVRQARVRASK